MDQSVFFNTVSTEASTWNISENGSLLQHQWSVFPSTDYLMWNRSNATNQLQWWSGGDTIVFNDSNSDGDWSFLMANNSQSNRSQSLLWSYVNGSGNTYSENVYVGPIFMNTTSGNCTMILFGNNSTFCLNRAFISGKWGLYNTEDFSYDPNGHGGKVIIPSDSIDYYNETIWGEMNLTEEGFYIKTIYNTYCGRIQSKAWGSNETDYTLMQEPTGWVIDQYFENATTINSTMFGVAVWNSKSANVNVSFDYINFWRLNYSLNYSANISWDSGNEIHPRPRMTFPVLDMNITGNDWWDLMIPYFRTDCNITNQTISKRMRNLTNNMSMESRPFDVNLWADFDSPCAQSDNVYYYTSVLTNFSSWYLANMGEFPEYLPPASSFSNNYLIFYIHQCEDGDDWDSALGYDCTFISIDIDNNREWNDNDRAFAINDWGEMYSWKGVEMDTRLLMWIEEEGAMFFNDSQFIGFSWLEETNSPRNLHRYNRHFHTLMMIPLWTLVKENGDVLSNDDVFGLHIASYNDRPLGMCVWENWAEKNCSTFHNETDVDNIADLYWNGTADFLEGFWDELQGDLGDCLDDCRISCAKYFWWNYTLYLECFEACADICLDACDSCKLNIDDDNIDMWGEGSIPGVPLINSTAGRFAVNISIDLNISYLNETETGNPGDNTSINVTFIVCNEGDMPITGLQLNLTWLNCSCDGNLKFWYVDSNIDGVNITWYNDTGCYSLWNLSNMTGDTCLDYWININITECVDYVGDVWIEAEINTSSGLGASANDSTRLRWGIEGDYLHITGAESVVSPFKISETVLFFVGICLIIAALLGLIAVVKSGLIR